MTTFTLASQPVDRPRVSGVDLVAPWRARQPLLATLAELCLWALIPCALAMWLDARTVNGISVWIKPAKFFASLALYYATLAWMFGLLPRETQSTRSGRTIIGLAVAAGAYEMTWLVAAAVAGVPSHFNRTHWAWATAYNLAGLGATLLLVAVWMQGRLIARDRQVPLHPAFRLSLVIGARLAFVATLITAGVLASGNGHGVGAAVANDAAGWPVLGWSRSGGDLRVAHFFALHAHQVLPLAGAAIVASGATNPSWASRAVWAATLAYSAMIAGTFVQALMGRPFLG